MCDDATEKWGDYLIGDTLSLNSYLDSQFLDKKIKKQMEIDDYYHDHGVKGSNILPITNKNGK
jgi:hypothetical protein